jgi:cobalamin biosynthesis Mg chelatase CobN
MKVGKYDIRIQVGPSYSTKREESRDGMMEFLRVNPAAAPLVSDLIAKSQDWPDSDRFAERLRKALPPGVAEDEEEEMTPEQMAMKQQAMQAQQQQMQAQQAAEQIAMREAEAKAAKAEADAAKAKAEAEIKQIELAAMNGQISRMMDDQARVLMAGVDAVTRPVGMPPQGAM